MIQLSEKKVLDEKGSRSQFELSVIGSLPVSPRCHPLVSLPALELLKVELARVIGL